MQPQDIEDVMNGHCYWHYEHVEFISHTKLDSEYICIYNKENVSDNIFVNYKISGRSLFQMKIVVILKKTDFI